MSHFRAVVPSDTPALLALAVGTAPFMREEAHELLGGVLDDLHAEHQAHEDEGRSRVEAARA